MNNAVVKYSNYMNNLKFTGFTAVDFDFLMALCSKLRDKDVVKVTIPFSEIREKTGYTQCSIKQFVSDLKRMNDKLMKITCSLETESEIIMFVLFPTFVINLDTHELIVSVNEKFKFVLNEIIKNFTRFDLIEFVRLDSKYSKTLYRLLKQYKYTGRYEVSLDDFWNKMDIPKTYVNKRVMDDVIKPALKELKSKNCFENLECTVQYARKRGRPVTGYIFTFIPEEREDSMKEKKSFLEEKKKSVSKQEYGRDYSSKRYEDLEKQLINHRLQIKKNVIE